MHLTCYLVVLLVCFFETSILSFLVTNPFWGVTKGFGFSPFIALSPGVSLKLLSGYLAID
jgi:hypothetical protein